MQTNTLLEQGWLQNPNERHSMGLNKCLETSQCFLRKVNYPSGKGSIQGWTCEVNQSHFSKQILDPQRTHANLCSIWADLKAALLGLDSAPPEPVQQDRALREEGSHAEGQKAPEIDVTGH